MIILYFVYQTQSEFIKTYFKSYQEYGDFETLLKNNNKLLNNNQIHIINKYYSLKKKQLGYIQI